MSDKMGVEIFMPDNRFGIPEGYYDWSGVVQLLRTYKKSKTGVTRTLLCLPGMGEFFCYIMKDWFFSERIDHSYHVDLKKINGGINYKGSINQWRIK